MQNIQGYWTYELCLKSNVTQFHSIIKGSDRRNVARLGEYDTTAADGVQKYLDGDPCGKDNVPPRARETSVRIGCGRHDRIVAIREPATCAYELEVELRAVCVPEEDSVASE